MYDLTQHDGEPLASEDFYYYLIHNLKEWVYTNYQEKLAPLQFLNQRGYDLYLYGPDLFTVAFGKDLSELELTVYTYKAANAPAQGGALAKEFGHEYLVEQLPYGQIRIGATGLKVMVRHLGSLFPSAPYYKGPQLGETLGHCGLLNIHAASFELFSKNFLPDLSGETIMLKPLHSFADTDNDLYDAYLTQEIRMRPEVPKLSGNQIQWLKGIVELSQTLTGWAVCPKLAQVLEGDVSAMPEHVKRDKPGMLL